MKMKKIVYLALLIASGILLQILEGFLPSFVPIPGFKLGLANLVSLVALSMFGIQAMWQVGLSRIVLASLLQGTLFSVMFWISLSGCVFSLVAMSIGFKSRWFSLYGISVLGSAFHICGQVLMVTFLYQQYFMQFFLPILLALSIVSGLCVGKLVDLGLKSLQKGKTTYGV